MIWQYRLADCCSGKDGVNASEAVSGLPLINRLFTHCPFYTTAEDPDLALRTGPVRSNLAVHRPKRRT
jgi:hypothetical protein